jgi:hypothetical protein
MPVKRQDGLLVMRAVRPLVSPTVELRANGEFTQKAVLHLPN